MDVTVFILECAILCAAFFVLVFGLLLWNPVSFISDYPPEIQAQYYQSQHKEAVKEKLTIFMVIKKAVALVLFAFLFAWMAHRAGAATFLQGLTCVYGYTLVLFAFDTFFMDWVLFANIKKIRLPGTEDMDSAYHQKWFHVKVCLPMLPVFALGGLVIAALMCRLW